MKLSEKQVEALITWALESKRPGGCSGWGPTFDAAMEVAQDLAKQDTLGQLKLKLAEAHWGWHEAKEANNDIMRHVHQGRKSAYNDAIKLLEGK